MGQRVMIVDFGMGNHHSVMRKLQRLNVDAVLSSLGIDVLKADKIILPGVGHFGRAMENLHSLNLTNALNAAVLTDKKPVLGICLGMQLMAKKSDEGDAKGLGWLNAEVVRLNIKDRLRFKVPHTGWNSVSLQKESRLFKGLPDHSFLYFVHSFHLVCQEKDEVLGITQYEQSFVSAVEKENIFGVQFHPEKSHEAGLQLLKNFIDL
jgi:glutamine amidotransferase